MKSMSDTNRKAKTSMKNQTDNSKSNESPAALRKNMVAIVLCLVAIAVVAGCAKTKITRHPVVTEQLPKPAVIWVYDFVATPADLPADSALAGESSLDVTPQTSEDVALGQQLGAEIASKLIEEIRGMGMTAMRAVPGTRLQTNDLMFRGYILSVKEGDATKRVAIGFGSGASELHTLVEGFQITPQGLRKLGSATLESGGNKTPGAAMGVATFLATANPAGLIVSSGMKVYGEASGKSKVEGRAQANAKGIAYVLKQRFQEQGWIK